MIGVMMSLPLPLMRFGPPNGTPNEITGYSAPMNAQPISWTRTGVPRKNQM